MAYRRKSWTEKWAEAVGKKDLPKIWDCPEKHERFVVPNPAEIEEIVRNVPAGKIVTMAEIAETLAKKHGTDSCCPMTTGIFAWILAHAAVEAKEISEDGLAKVPWWRVVKTGGELNPKYPGAPELQTSLLEAEGWKVRAKGKKMLVEGIA